MDVKIPRRVAWHGEREGAIDPAVRMERKKYEYMKVRTII